ncbi:MAG: tRNA pseudouridine(55) synthase TruB [Beijerinckiaceae bacterium]|jgi:tRNA pseudouridine55 synthase|nr:tRNA pseudouridine(55) synthase TruB [Beijerinckiaceae bacterium]
MTETLSPPGQRPKKRDVHGWLILDKPVGMTSTHAVAIVKRVFRAKKAGHAGTLDPLASGCLPIALGEATKTVPYVMDGKKAYRFTVTWGIETTTDDTEGTPARTSDRRPARAEVEAMLPRFTGAILQVPPKFSAIKVDGERAYDLARDGEEVELEAREVLIDSLSIVAHNDNATTLQAECGKGTYVRAIARDLGRALGCFGHVTALRRTRVGPFLEEQFIAAEDLTRTLPDPAEQEAHVAALLAPVDRGLAELAELQVSRHDAARLKRGQGVILRGRDAPTALGHVAVHAGHELIAIGEIDKGELRPHRVFNLG